MAQAVPLELPEDTEQRTSSSHRFLVGKDSHGNWVVQDIRGLCGGLFVSCAEACRFAAREQCGHLEDVMIVPWILEFSANRPASPPAKDAPDDSDTLGEGLVRHVIELNPRRATIEHGAKTLELATHV